MPTTTDCLVGIAVRTSSGFTLPELVATLVIIGIMAAVVVPRFASRSDFDAFGFAEQTRAGLRFAQKTAIAKRRQVCVAIAGNSLSLSFATNFGGACDRPVFGPASNQAYVLAATSGIAITAANFSFDALGRPSAGQALSVTGGSAAKLITVEAETGYVH